MARTIDEIQQTMIDGVQADPVLSPVATSTSKTALWLLWTRICAVCGWTIETLFDTFKGEVNETIAILKPHSLRWYATIAKAFQYGYALPADSDVYDNSALTPDQIATSKIITYAAVTVGDTDRIMRIKVAKQSTDLTPLSDGEKAAFTAYMELVKDAGVKLNIESNAADSLKTSIEIYYDPLILDADGSRIDGMDDQPIQNAITSFLQNLPFNGVFVVTYFLEALQAVSGVVIANIVSCETKFGAFDFTTVNVQYLPDAGYLRIADPDTDLTITFIPQSSLS